MPSTKARRLCKNARCIDLVGCIGGSVVHWRTLELPNMDLIELLVEESIRNNGKLKYVRR
jgi:hypothetical protein